VTRRHTPFRLSSGKLASATHFRTITGEEEGFFAWLAANQLSGRDMTSVGAADARQAPHAAARPGALGRRAVQPAAPERRRARLRLRGGVQRRGSETHTDFCESRASLETGGGSAERREETRRARKRAAPPSRASSRRAPFERARASVRGRVSSFRARRAAGGRRAGVRGRVSRRRVSGQTQVRVAAVGGARTRVGRSHSAQRALRRGVRKDRAREPPALSSGNAHNFGVGLVGESGERRRGNDASSEGEGEASIRGEAPDAPRRDIRRRRRRISRFGFRVARGVCGGGGAARRRRRLFVAGVGPQIARMRAPE